MSTHELKVIPPYFDALVSGAKTFEVRKNDRAFQRGDILKLREWHPNETGYLKRCDDCGHWQSRTEYGHWSDCPEYVEREVTYVLSGDPRFGGIEAGYVVLGLAASSPVPETQ